MSAIINFSKVTKAFTSKSGKIQALAELSFEMPANSLFGLAGINGAGKTTAVKAMLGLCRPDSGTITINGQSPAALNLGRIGFSPENPDLPGYLTVAEAVDYSCALLEHDLTAEKLHELLSLLELSDCANQSVATLSKGNRQRLSLAVAIAHEPDLIILDEPTSGLDPLGRKLVKRLLLQQKAAGKAVFFSTHILSDLREICDYIGIIHQGTMVFSGRSEEFCPGHDIAALEERFSSLTGAVMAPGGNT